MFVHKKFNCHLNNQIEYLSQDFINDATNSAYLDDNFNLLSSYLSRSVAKLNWIIIQRNDIFISESLISALTFKAFKYIWEFITEKESVWKVQLIIQNNCSTWKTIQQKPFFSIFQDSHRPINLKIFWTYIIFKSKISVKKEK